jgi:hypothetical protein
VKAIFTFFVTLFVGASQSFAFDISQPEANVGTNWAFERIDSYTGLVKSTWKNVVDAKTSTNYSIARYGDTGSLLYKHKLTKNLGQGSPTRFGKIGNGDLLKFPLTLGKEWNYVNYWVSGSGEAGRDEITFKVVGQEAVTTKAGTFDVVKIQGSGRWYNETANTEEGMEVVLYYSPKAQTAVRTDRVQHMPAAWRVPPTRERIDLIAYELK